MCSVKGYGYRICLVAREVSLMRGKQVESVMRGKQAEGIEWE